MKPWWRTTFNPVRPGSTWVAGGDIFPFNRPLSAELAARAGQLVVVDPDATAHRDISATEKRQAFIEALPSPSASTL